MSKVPHHGNSPIQPHTIASVGGTLVLLGGLVIAGVTVGGMEAAPWVKWAGAGVSLLGAVIWYFSGLPREQSIEWIKSGAVALMVALTIRWAFAEPYRIPSGSMEPTLQGDPRLGKGDRVFVNKWYYGIRVPFLNKRLYQGAEPQRWDIVVFKTIEPDALHPTLVKRVVGLPGEHIQVQNGKIVADGVALELDPKMPDSIYYTNNDGRMKYGVRPEEEFSVVPEGHYLVMGDNSSNSRDGRYFGWLPNEHIVGRVSSVWWPVRNWSDFTGYSRTWWWKSFLFLLGLGILSRLFVGQSFPLIDEDTRKVDHIFVNFACLGLRIPFTPWWLKFWGKPQRNDLVVFHAKHKDLPGGAMLHGRVMGLGGEVVSINDGKLFVNDAEVTDLPWDDDTSLAMKDKSAVFAKQKKHQEVPLDHLFILADEPGEADALDSRILGWIPQEQLLGQATRIWWPRSRARKL